MERFFSYLGSCSRGPWAMVDIFGLCKIFCRLVRSDQLFNQNSRRGSFHLSYLYKNVHLWIVLFILFV